MAGQSRSSQRGARGSGARRQKDRMRVYRRRRLVAFILGVALLVGLYFGLDWVLTRLLLHT